MGGIIGTDGGDRLEGTSTQDTPSGADTIFGLQGDDRINGQSGPDRLFGGPGRDRLLGDLGDDQLFGDDGEDVLKGGPGSDQLFGGRHDDLVLGGDGQDLLVGDTGTDTLIGGSGDDLMAGGPGPDLLFGDEGSDFLEGGYGSDRLSGGADADRFALPEPGHGFDEILDFDVTAGDRLDFPRSLRTAVDDGVALTEAVRLDATPAGTLVAVRVDEHDGFDDVALLRDVRVSELDGPFFGGQTTSAADDQAQTFENDPVIIPVLDNDVSPADDPLVLNEVRTTHTSGKVALTDIGVIVYDPGGAFDYLGVGEGALDRFGYSATNDEGTFRAEVVVRVVGINDQPSAVADVAMTDAETATQVEVLANDTDPDATDLLVIESVDSTGTTGRVSLTSGGAVLYNPAGQFTTLGAGASATDSFSYTISDGYGGTSSAQATVTVRGLNDAPLALAISQTTVSETSPAGSVIGTLTATDPDEGDTFTYALIDDAGGRFAVDGDRLVVADASRIESEQAQSHDLIVRVTDSGGLTFDQALTVQVISRVDLSELDGTEGFRLDGIGPGDRSGTSVSDAGDINGDGFDDVLVGAPFADPSAVQDAGASYVVFVDPGGFDPSLDLALLDGNNGFRISGIGAGDRAGVAVGGAGDVNGDGLADLVIGAAETGTRYGGESYVVLADPDGFGGRLNLAGLDGSNGFRLADAPGLGASVSGAGDVNGDGFADVIVGAPDEVITGSRGQGAAYVVFGAGAGFDDTLELATLDGSNGFRIGGFERDAYLGRSVSGAGDVNGDGFDDVIVGSRRYDQQGESYVVFGKSGGFAASVEPADLDGTNGFRVQGIVAGEQAGFSVSGAGDVNGDGFDDLILGTLGAFVDGAPFAGAAYVVFGEAEGFGGALRLDALDGSNGFRLDGIDPNDYAGTSVSGAGDVNGDGFGDLLVGAALADPGGLEAAGESYVVFGSPSGHGGELDLAALDGANGFQLAGDNPGDQAGASVSRAGDVDGDGLDDFIIGAPGADPDGVEDAGTSYIVFGREIPVAAHEDGAAKGGVLAMDSRSDEELLLSGRGDLDGLLSADDASGLDPASLTDGSAEPPVISPDASMFGSSQMDLLIGPGAEPGALVV